MTENKFSLVDLGKLSKPVSKLIEAVSQGIGTLYEPTKIRRKAKAQADASIISAEAEIKKQELLKRAFKRFAFQEMGRQENIENIIKIAAANMGEKVSEEPVDRDWISRFFDTCKDISKEELQKIWGRLLAGEVARPNSYSINTLSILKNLNQEDAQLFNDFCSYIWVRKGNLFYMEDKDIFFIEEYYFMPIDPISLPNLLQRCVFTYSELLHLRALA